MPGAEAQVHVSYKQGRASPGKRSSTTTVMQIEPIKAWLRGFANARTRLHSPLTQSGIDVAQTRRWTRRTLCEGSRRVRPAIAVPTASPSQRYHAPQQRSKGRTKQPRETEGDANGAARRNGSNLTRKIRNAECTLLADRRTLRPPQQNAQ